MAAGTLLACVEARGQDAVLELVLDGRTAAVGRFLIRDGVPHATLAAWRGWGLRVPADAATDAAQSLIGANELPGVTARVDAATQTLALITLPDLSSLTLLGRAAATAEADPAREFGALVNYDVHMQRAASANRHAALLDARLFGPAGLFEHSLVVSNTARSRQRRLNTSFTRVEPQNMQRWRVGDFIAGGLSWTRPVRLAGLQAMKDFGLRPDLVTTPTPELGGTVAVPSTVEVLVNGVRQLSQPVEPGRFEVRQLPIVSGAGQVALVVRDALGRETVRSLPFYAAARQLAPGLAEYSMQAGWVRRNFGIESNDYGPFAASASLRTGWSRELTLEGHVEATPGTAVAGGAALWTVPRLGLLNASLAASRSAGQHGLLLAIGAERRSDNAHVALSLARASEGYRDIAASLGEPLPARSLRLSAGTSLGRFGAVGIAWLGVKTAPALAAAAQRLATASWSVALSPSVQAFVSTYRSHGSDRAQGISLHLSMPLNAGSSGSVAVTDDLRGASLAVQAHRQAAEAGEFGWRVQSERRLAGDATDRQQAAIEYRSSAAGLSAAVETAAGVSATRFAAQGAVVYAAGALHATPPVGDSLAVIDLPGLPGVAVYRENRLVGRTDADGQLVLPDLLPYQANRVAIEALDLPADAEFDRLVRDVRPHERSGVIVRYGIRRVPAVLVLLEDAAGRPLALGAVANAADGSSQYPVGHDGQVYLREPAAANEWLVTWGTSQRCTVQFRLADLDPASGRIGPVPCR